MNKSVFIFSQIPLVDGNSAGTQRMKYYSKLLAESDVDVYNVIFSVYDFSTNDIKQVDNRIFKVNDYVPKHSGILKKFLLYFSFANKLYDLATKIVDRNNRIFILYPTVDFLFTFITLFFLKLKHEKIFIEFNEVRKVVYTNVFLKSMYILQDNLLHFFSGVICISRNILNYAQKYSNRVYHMPILFDYQNIVYETKTDAMPDPFIILFTGQVSFRKENLFALFDGLRNVKSNIKWELYLFGTVSPLDEEDLHLYINKFRLNDKIKYKGEVSHEIVIEEQKKASLLVLPRRNIPQNYYGFSTKLSEYIASQVPILLTCTGNTTDYFKNCDNCFLVDGFDSEDFTRTFDFIFKHYAEYRNNIVYEALLTGKKYFDYRLYKESFLSFLFG